MKAAKNLLTIILVFAFLFTTQISEAVDRYLPAGTLTGSDLHWTTQYDSYIAQDNIEVADGCTLVIDPGVIAKFDDDISLKINGGATMSAIGTQNNVITFTSTAGTDYWGYIQFDDYDEYSGSTGEFDYCVIEYGGGTQVSYRPAAISVTGTYHISEVELNNTVIRYSEGYAISTSHYGLFEAIDCKIHDNAGGIYQVEGYNTKIIGNQIYNHTEYGCYVSAFRGELSNNYFKDSDNTGIYVSQIEDGTIYNNVVNGNESGGDYGIYLVSNSDADYLRNNIVVNCEYGFRAPSSVCLLKYHCVYNSGTTDIVNATVSTGTFIDDPKFVDPSGDDYRLTYQSPCINAGEYDEDLLDPDNSTNDMGIYGGPDAWQPYYVLIPSTATLFNMTLPRSTYRVRTDINLLGLDVPNTCLLTISDGTRMMFDEGKSLLVNSYGQLTAQGTGSLGIIMESHNSMYYWDGIIIQSTSSTSSRLEYLSINNCSEEGIRCDGITLTNPISHCDFTDCDYDANSTGVYLDGSDTDVEYCTFEDCNNAIVMDDSDADISNCEITAENYGIWIRDGSSITLDANTIDAGEASGTGIYINSSDATLTENNITLVDRGLHFVDCDPIMQLNVIENCVDEGMYLITGSQPVMSFAQEHADNRIADCGGYEIYISGHLYPVIGGGYNDLLDYDLTGTDYVIYSAISNNVEYSVDATWNYWYITSSEEAVRALIFPPDDPPDYIVDVYPFCTTSNTGYTTSSLEEEELLAAMELEFDGEYEDALTAYQSIVTDYPDDAATVTAMRRMIYCYDHLDADFEDLYDYYVDLEDSISNESTIFSLQRLQGRALRENGDYGDAMDHLEDMLLAVTNLTDSVFVLIDIENTLYEAVQNGFSISGATGNNYTDPAAGWCRFNERLKELHQLAESTVQRDDDSFTMSPLSFELHGNYPNPFNPVTTLSYCLTEKAKVNLAVYDISGRKVAGLVDGWRDVGQHEVTFDGTGLASGIYIYRLQAGEFTAQGKMVLMK